MNESRVKCSECKLISFLCLVSLISTELFRISLFAHYSSLCLVYNYSPSFNYLRARRRFRVPRWSTTVRVLRLFFLESMLAVMNSTWKWHVLMRCLLTATSKWRNMRETMFSMKFCFVIVFLARTDWRGYGNFLQRDEVRYIYIPFTKRVALYGYASSLSFMKNQWFKLCGDVLLSLGLLRYIVLNPTLTFTSS